MNWLNSGQFVIPCAEVIWCGSISHSKLCNHQSYHKYIDVHILSFIFLEFSGFILLNLIKNIVID